MSTSTMARTLYEQTKQYRGGINVWRKSKGKTGRSPVMAGGTLMNPFQAGGVFYAADLAYFNAEDKEVTVLKVFEVAEAVTADATTVLIKADDFSHIPSVGDVVMIAPATATTGAKAVSITHVEFITESSMEFLIVLDSALGAISAGTLLVEAEAAVTTGAKPKVATVNTFLETDFVQEIGVHYQFGILPNPTIGLTVIEHEEAKKHKMCKLPAYIESQNKSAFPSTYFQL